MIIKQKVKRIASSIVMVPVNVALNLIDAIVRSIPIWIVMICALGVLVCGVMVGAVQHKPVLCYAFAAWWFGIMGVGYLALLAFLKVTAPLK